MIETWQVTREELFTCIESQETLWVRIAATKEDDEWRGSVLEVTSAAHPPGWVAQRWDYDEVVFVSIATTGVSVGEWLRSELAIIDDLSIKLPTVQDLPNCDRHQSKARTGYEVLDWPSNDYQPMWASSHERSRAGPRSLIGRSAPSFINVNTATGSFFGVDLGLNGSMRDSGPIFRHQDCSGRIAGVRLSAVEIEVTVEGMDLSEAAVELASDVGGTSKMLSGNTNEVVVFSLPGGLPRGAWVVLKRDGSWLDRRFLAFPYAIQPEPGVEMIAEPQDHLQALVAAGEGPRVEFKQELPKPGSPGDNVLKTVSAFANADGGGIVFGVTDMGEVCGLELTKVEQRSAVDALTDRIRTRIAPLPDFMITAYDIPEFQDRVVFVLIVEAGTAPPYGLDPGKPRYYVRRGATSFPASADQVRELARSRPAISPATVQLGLA